MRFWILERRQQVLTADDMTAEELRAIVGELDDEQRAAELNQARLRAIVLHDELTITPAIAEVTPTGVSVIDEMNAQRDSGPGARSTNRLPARPGPTPKPAKRVVASTTRLKYPCAFCDRAFEWAPGRASHERNAHPNEVAERLAERGGDPRRHASRPAFDCPDCPASFSSDQGLKVHRGMQHPPERPKAIEPLKAVKPATKPAGAWRGIEEAPTGTMRERLEAAKRRREAGLA